MVCFLHMLMYIFSFFFKGFLRVVDIPGHERVRQKFFDDYKSICKAVMFVIDSVTLQKEIRDVAE